MYTSMLLKDLAECEVGLKANIVQAVAKSALVVVWGSSWSYTRLREGIN